MISKFVSKIRRAPKRASAIIAILAAVLIVPATLFAWGPMRPTYTMDRPADHITFNSITNNPNLGNPYGDERNFVGIRETGTNNSWVDNMTVQNGRTYTVRMYVHNNAAENLHLVAENVKAKVNLPTTTGRSIRVDGFINSTNANPVEVYDDATFSSSQDFNLAYVPGSLKFENNVFGPNGIALSESIFTSRGATLGYSRLDGRIPGCIRFAGYVSFIVRPQFAGNSNFRMAKRVSRHGANSWVESYSAQPGETVDYLIEYRNTGTVQQNNVTLRDSLPVGQTYISGSTRFGNSQHPSGVQASDNIANGVGINIGSYAPNANAWAIFSARVADNDDLPECGLNTLVNTARVTVGGWALTDPATVIVNRICEGRVHTCNRLSGARLSGNSFRFTTDYTLQNVTFNNITYVVRDSNNSRIYQTTTRSNVFSYATNTIGDYSVQATVNSSADGDSFADTSNGCRTGFSVTGETPSELPVTGPIEDFGALLGLGSLTASIGYYRASRRSRS